MLRFDEALASLTPRDFVERILVDALGARTVLVGTDFRFGRGGAGNPERSAGARRASSASDVDVVGDVRSLEQRPPRVVHLDPRAARRRATSRPPRGCSGARTPCGARSCTVPSAGASWASRRRTCRSELEGFVPADGVYAGWLVDEGSPTRRSPRASAHPRYPAAISVGTNPTFDDVHEPPGRGVRPRRDRSRSVRTRCVEVQFVERVRGMVAFDGIDAAHRADGRRRREGARRSSPDGPAAVDRSQAGPPVRSRPWMPSCAVADAAAPQSVNLWGALGCAVAYSASLLATLDAFADLILASDDSPAGRLTPAVGLKFGSKIAAAAIAVIAAAIVLALDGNWFAFTSLTIAFLVVVGIGLTVLLRHAKDGARRHRRRVRRDPLRPDSHDKENHEPDRTADAARARRPSCSAVSPTTSRCAGTSTAFPASTPWGSSSARRTSAPARSRRRPRRGRSIGSSSSSTSRPSRAPTPPARCARSSAKALNPDASDPTCPRVAAVCVYGDMVPYAVEALGAAHGDPDDGRVSVAAVATAFPSGRASLEIKLADTAEAVAARRRRDRHGDRSRSVPRRAATDSSSTRSPASSRRAAARTAPTRRSR